MKMVSLAALATPDPPPSYNHNHQELIRDIIYGVGVPISS